MRRRKKAKPGQAGKLEALTIEVGNAVRIVGHIDPVRKIFYKHVRKSKHLYRKLDAWAIDAEIFKTILLPKILTIRIRDDESGVIYQTTVKSFDEYGTYLHFKPERAQIFLPRQYFQYTMVDGKTHEPVPLSDMEKKMQDYWDSLPDKTDNDPA